MRIKQFEFYACSHCDFTTDRPDRFRNHSKCHTTPAQFRCSICPYWARLEMNVRRHEKFHHISKNLNRRERTVSTHSAEPSKRPRLKKNQVSRDQQPKERLTEATQSSQDSDLGSSSSSSDKPFNPNYDCPKCTKPFSSLARFRKHVVLHVHSMLWHQKMKLNKEVRQISKKAELIRFYKAIKSRAQHLTRARSYTCRACSLVFRARSNYIQHLRSHSKAKRDGLEGQPTVQPEFVPLENRDIFKRKVGPVGRLDRLEFKIEFYTPEELRNANNELYSCTVCDYETSNSNHIRLHQKGHDETETKKFKCSSCPYWSDQKTLISQHEKLCHSKGLSLKCSICGHKASTNAIAVRHQRGHSVVQKFQCTFCPFWNDLKRIVTWHERKYHPGGNPSKSKGAKSSLSTTTKPPSKAPSKIQVDVKPYCSKGELSKVPGASRGIKHFSGAKAFNAPSPRGHSEAPSTNVFVKQENSSNINCKVELKRLRIFKKSLGPVTCSNRCPYCGKSLSSLQCCLKHIQVHLKEKKPKLEPITSSSG